MAGMNAAVKCWVWAAVSAFIALLCFLVAGDGDAFGVALLGVFAAIAAVALAADGLRHHSNQQQAPRA